MLGWNTHKGCGQRLCDRMPCRKQSCGPQTLHVSHSIWKPKLHSRSEARLATTRSSSMEHVACSMRDATERMQHPIEARPAIKQRLSCNRRNHPKRQCKPNPFVSAKCFSTCSAAASFSGAACVSGGTYGSACAQVEFMCTKHIDGPTQRHVGQSECIDVVLIALARLRGSVSGARAVFVLASFTGDLNTMCESRFPTVGGRERLSASASNCGGSGTRIDCAECRHTRQDWSNAG